MRTNRIVLSLILVALSATSVFAAGPLLLDGGTNLPFAYGPGVVPMYTDLGPLGPLTNAEADVLVDVAAAQWSGVATATFAAAVVGDFASIGLPDVNNGATANLVIGAINGPGIHVIYDSTEQVFFDIFGIPLGSGVLGIASPDFATGLVIDESWMIMGGGGVDPADAAGASFNGVVTHEMGHSINLAHAQLNGATIFFGDATGPGVCPTPYAGAPAFTHMETMYPFIDPSAGSIGIDMTTVDRLDDTSSLSDLYPAAGWPGTSITGTIFLSDGVSEVTGVNVIARNAADPFGDAISHVSGDFSQGNLGPDGSYAFNGLTAGADYIVYVNAIEAGGFSTSPVVPFPGDEEYYNNAESADPGLDDPCAVDAVTAGAAGINIIFNDQGPTLPLGDDDFIEVPLGFDFAFCDGNTYSTVFVGSNGFLTFGAGDTDFSESPGELVSGPPRIAMFWDDLSPNEGGTVTAENTGAEFVVTFSNVPQFFAGDANSFTCTLRPDGTYSIEYQGVNSTDGIVGRSNGGGAADPGSIDLSGEAQPFGFGQQTIYEQVAGPWDLDGTITEWLVCEQLPPPVLAIDPADFCFTVAVDGSDSGILNISNLATPPARDLEWSLDDIQLLKARRSPTKPSVMPEGMDPSQMMRQCKGCKHEQAAQQIRQDMFGKQLPVLSKANQVNDGSFELGAFGGAWVEASSNFGTPLCDLGTCGTGTGTGPNTGDWWCWFGGISIPETGSVSQAVTIPTGNVELSFYLEQIVCDSPADFMEVLIDGTQVFVSNGGSPLCGVLGYTLQTIDLDALGYADGGVHTLEFRSETVAANLGGSNFFVDDVVIDVVVGDCPWLTVAPTSGTTPAGGSTPVTLNVDATGLAPGTYNCDIQLTTNDGDVTIPVKLIVEGGNQPPVANCVPVVQITNNTSSGPCEANVDPSQVDNGSFDPDGGPVTLELIPAGPYPGGATPVTLSVTDDEGDKTTCQSIIVVDCPVPVQLASFNMDRDGWDAVLRWSVTRTDDLDGFHVYRQDSPESPRMRLTQAILPKATEFEFVDAIAPTSATTYFIEEVSMGGATISHGPFILGEGKGGAPMVSLAPGSPNPFRGQTNISYAMREGRPVRLAVYDLQGRLVSTLVNGSQGAGVYNVSWNGRTDNGAPVAAGVYVMRLQAGDDVKIQKVTMTR